MVCQSNSGKSTKYSAGNGFSDFLAIVAIGYFLGSGRSESLTELIYADFCLPKPYTYGLACVSGIVLVWLRWGLRQRPVARITVLGVIAAGYLFGVGSYSRYFYFNLDGTPRQWYASTPFGIRFYDRPGKEPEYGKDLQPASENIITAYRWSKGHRKNEDSDVELVFCFEKQGHTFLQKSPFTSVNGEILCECTKDQVRRYQEQEKQKLEANTFISQSDQKLEEFESLINAIEKSIDDGKESTELLYSMNLDYLLENAKSLKNSIDGYYKTFPNIRQFANDSKTLKALNSIKAEVFKFSKRSQFLVLELNKFRDNANKKWAEKSIPFEYIFKEKFGYDADIEITAITISKIKGIYIKVLYRGVEGGGIVRGLMCSSTNNLNICLIDENGKVYEYIKPQPVGLDESYYEIRPGETYRDIWCFAPYPENGTKFKLQIQKKTDEKKYIEYAEITLFRNGKPSQSVVEK